MILGTRAPHGNLIIDCQCEGCGEEFESLGGSLYDSENRYCPECCRDSDRSGEAGETALAGSTEGESAGLQGIAEPLSPHKVIPHE